MFTPIRKNDDGERLECENCGESWNAHESDARQANCFCSRDCEAEYYSGCVDDHCGECGEFESDCDCLSEEE